MWGLEKLVDYLGYYDIEKYLAMVAGVKPEKADEIAQQTKDFVENVSNEYFQDLVSDTVDAVFNWSEIWNSFWEQLQWILPPLYKQLGALNIIKDLEYQKGMVDLRPTQLDPMTAAHLYLLRPDLAPQLIDTLSKQGFDDDKIQMIFESVRNIPNEIDIRDNLYKGYIDKEQAYEKLRLLGVREEDLDFKVRTWFNVLNVEEVRNLMLRQLITSDEATERLKALGFTPGDSEQIKQLFFFIPPVQDLITMAVREVFSPDIASKFGQYEDYPEEFEQYAAQQGISGEWAKRYWAAHWNLPSLQMGFEMLHRRVIDNDTLNLLMRAQDVMPFWRDKLEAISYNPLTRVDVRRMYELGILDRTGVYNAYLDAGYNDTNAELMTAFTENYAIEHERDLSKTEIVNSYEDSLIDRSNCILLLQSLGYDETEADIILTLADYKKIKAINKLKIKTIRNQYKGRLINDGQASGMLSELGSNSDEINALLDSWESERKSDITLLSLDDLKTALQKGVVTEDVFRIKTSALGYQTEDINILIAITK